MMEKGKLGRSEDAAEDLTVLRPFSRDPAIRARLGLDVVVQLFLVMMAVAGAKEPPIAGHAAIRVLKQHMAKKPIFDANSSRTEELFAAAMRTTRNLSLRSGFAHGKSFAVDAYVTTSGCPNRSETSAPKSDGR
jgi:hypothetical protein